MSITTKDLARIAGVSQSTVSRSLNHSSLISEKTRNRILKIAEEQGFEFNASARSLTTNRCNTIGIIYPEDFMDFNANLYFGTFHGQLQQSLEQVNLDLLVAFANNRFSGASNVKKLIIGKKVDGLLIARSTLPPDTKLFLKSSKIPYVFLHHYLDDPDFEDADRVYTDHLRGGYLGTEHLLKLGHKRIMTITLKEYEGREYELRTEGYRLAHNHFGIQVDESLVIKGGSHYFQSGYDAIMQNKKSLKDITAVFAQNDMMALGVKEALTELSIRIPGDIAIVGFDDIEFCTYFKPHLTTIHQPREQMTKLACQRLLDRIESKRPMQAKDLKLQPTLVVRDSCGSLSS